MKNTRVFEVRKKDKVMMWTNEEKFVASEQELETMVGAGYTPYINGKPWQPKKKRGRPKTRKDDEL